MQKKHKYYEKYIKRLLDIICGLLAVIVFCWLYALIALLVRIKLGSPVLFKQQRPGKIDPKTGEERIFNLYKFRTMTDERDENGQLLPDEFRLTKFGNFLRSTSLDELPEALCIITGSMSIVGPRPLLVQYLPLYSEHQRHRHDVRPGLSGLAQINGRNALTWHDKFELDVKYSKEVSFCLDFKIVAKTIIIAAKREGINNDNAATMEAFTGDN